MNFLLTEPYDLFQQLDQLSKEVRLIDTDLQKVEVRITVCEI